MAESHPLSESCEDSLEDKLSAILKKCTIVKSHTTRYILNTTKLTEETLVRKERIGEVDDQKPHKVILLIGETGSGKTTLINAMVNYLMGVRWEHRMWLEVAETSDDQTQSQTTAVTVLEVFPQGSPFSLKIVDTPGFGDTRGNDNDAYVSEALQELFRSEDGIHEIHAVCLVLKASDARLHERQQYIFDEVLSLFGKDIKKHILILITNAGESAPRKALNLIKKSKIPCAERKDNEPVYFKFDNCQSECYEEEDRESYKSSWDLGNMNIKQFFDYLNGINPKSLHMTEGVLRSRKQLDASLNNLQERIKWAEKSKKVLEETKATVEEYEKNGGKLKKGECVAEETFKELVPINASWWHKNKQATHCGKCEENCHYPGCWWVSNLSNCSVMKNGDCTVCSKGCSYTKHTKDDKKYEVKTRRIIREDLIKKLENYEEKKKFMIDLQKEIKDIQEEKIRLVEKCYQCLEKVMETALKSTTMSSIIHLDFLIERVRESGNQERVKKLEELKKKAEEENPGLLERALVNLKLMRTKDSSIVSV